MPRGARAEGWEGWDSYAAFYDWENARTVQRRDIRFWQLLAAACDGPVLELGCGTGRILLPVAKVCARLVGIDRSVPMLRRARGRLARAKLDSRATLVRGDIRALPFRRGRFALVMAPYGILQSLVRARDLRLALESIARVTAKGARLGIDLVPDLPRWSEYRRRKTLSGAMGRNTRVTLVESVRQDRLKQLTIFDQHYVATRGRSRREHRFSLTFRTVSVPRMVRILERSGFRVDAVLGDYRGGPWDARADVWVILATRR